MKAECPAVAGSLRIHPVRRRQIAGSLDEFEPDVVHAQHFSGLGTALVDAHGDTGEV